MGYDAIVIGAGLGGCSAAAVLAGAGGKVLVLERMPQVGGRCSSIVRDGFTLDTGAHGIFGCEHGAIEEACRRVGKGGTIDWHHFKKLAVRLNDMRVYWDQNTVTIKMDGRDDIVFDYMALLNTVFPMIPGQAPPEFAYDVMGTLISAIKSVISPVADAFDRTPLRDCLTMILRPVIGTVGMAIPLVANVMSEAIEDYDRNLTTDFLSRFITWPRLSDIINTFQCGMFGTPDWLTSTAELLRTLIDVLDQYHTGMDIRDLAGYPRGGLIKIPATLCEGIRECGGEIRTGVNVSRILVEDGKAQGVITDDGEKIKAPVVISNAGIKETVSDLVGREHFDPEYADWIMNLKAGVSGFCLRAALDEPVTDMDTGGILLPEPGTMDEYWRRLWVDLTIPDAVPPIYFGVPSNMDPSLAPPGMQLIVGIGAMMYDSKDPYSKIEELILDGFEATFPGFRDHLLWYDFIDPGVYVSLGERLAPAIGLAQCVGQAGPDRPSSIMPIEGLYACGGEAGANISGMACDMCVRSGIACGDYIVGRSVFISLLEDTDSPYMNHVIIISAITFWRYMFSASLVLWLWSYFLIASIVMNNIWFPNSLPEHVERILT